MIFHTQSSPLGISWLPLTRGILTGPWMMQLWPAATALSMSATVMSSVLAAAKVVVLSLVSVSMIVDFDSWQLHQLINVDKQRSGFHSLPWHLVENHELLPLSSWIEDSYWYRSCIKIKTDSGLMFNIRNIYLNVRNDIFATYFS